MAASCWQGSLIPTLLIAVCVLLWLGTIVQRPMQPTRSGGVDASLQLSRLGLLHRDLGTNLTPSNSTILDATLPATSKLPVDIVISHFNEDLSWLQPAVTNLCGDNVIPWVYIYKKSEVPERKQGEDGADITCPMSMPECTKCFTTRLPNVGRESYAYLYHMQTLRLRPSKAIVTLYLQAKPHTLVEGKGEVSPLQFVKLILQQALEHGLSVNVQNIENMWRSAYHFNHWRLKNENHAVGMTLGEWFESRCAVPLNYHFPSNLSVRFYVGANFAVHNSLQMPPSIIKAGLADLEVGNAPEVGHFFERVWFLIFWRLRERLPNSPWRNDPLDPLEGGVAWDLPMRGRLLIRKMGLDSWLT